MMTRPAIRISYGQPRKWRNGIRVGLKNRWAQALEGSNPSFRSPSQPCVGLFAAGGGSGTLALMDQAERLGRLARLAVEVGANVQPGQVVVTGLVEHAALAREVARAAYRAGARLVVPRYADRHFTRALIELAPEE